MPLQDTALPGDRAPLVIVFAPHPDDEMIACGGTIIRQVTEGARVKIVFSTDGSMSHSAVLGIDDPTPEELTVIRQGEAVRAAARAGVAEADLHFLGFTDTRLADSLPEFRTAVTRVLEANRDVAEVYLPHEIRELNADHRFTGEIVLECLAACGLSPALHKFVVWDDVTEAEFGFVNRRPAERYGPTAEKLISYDISRHLADKLAALREHRTQVSLFSARQTRTVVPPSFLERLEARTTEEFWIPLG